MLKELVKVANRLDHLGLQKEADVIDNFIQKVAGGRNYGTSFVERRDEDGRSIGMVGLDYPVSEMPLSLKAPRKETSKFNMIGDLSLEDVITDSENPLYNPHHHGIPSYEMDTEEIEEGIDKERELNRMYPAVTSYRRG